MSHITIIGNLTSDPIKRYTQSGVCVTDIAVAENRDITTGGEEVRKTDYFDAKAWRQLGENVADSFKKGDRVIVVGRLELETWVDKETGQNRRKHVLVAHTVGAAVNFAKVDGLTKTNGRDAAPQVEGEYANAGGEEPF